MSLCNACRQPGRCCTGFALPIRGDTALEVLVQLAAMHHGLFKGHPNRLSHEDCVDPQRRAHVEHAAVGLPFIPLNPVPGGWRFWCPLLGRDGRCTEYDHRPALCRAYQPASDPICAEWVPDEPDAR